MIKNCQIIFPKGVHRTPPENASMNGYFYIYCDVLIVAYSSWLNQITLFKFRACNPKASMVRWHQHTTSDANNKKREKDRPVFVRAHVSCILFAWPHNGTLRFIKASLLLPFSLFITHSNESYTPTTHGLWQGQDYTPLSCWVQQEWAFSTRCVKMSFALPIRLLSSSMIQSLGNACCLTNIKLNERDKGCGLGEQSGVEQEKNVVYSPLSYSGAELSGCGALMYSTLHIQDSRPSTRWKWPRNQSRWSFGLSLSEFLALYLLSPLYLGHSLPRVAYVYIWVTFRWTSTEVVMHHGAVSIIS